jgi:hypothetical protein
MLTYAVVHLLSGVLDEVGQEVCKHVGHEGGAHRHEERASLVKNRWKFNETWEFKGSTEAML